MSEERSSDIQPPSEPKTEDTGPLKEKSEPVPVSDTDLSEEKSFSDFKQGDNNVNATKEQKKISEVSTKKNPNLKSSIPRLASTRTPSTIGRPTQPHSSVNNKRLESSLKTILQQKQQVKERQSLVLSPSKVKPNSSQKANVKSLMKSPNQSSHSNDASPTRIYISEKKKFDNILNELVEKQEEILRIHSKLTYMKDKVSLSHKDIVHVRDLKLVDLRDMLYEKNAHIEGHDLMFQNTSDDLVELERRLYDLPKATVKFCEDVLNHKEAVIKLLCDINNANLCKDEKFSEDLSKQIETFNSEGSGLLENLQVLQNQQAELIGGIARDYSTLCGRAQKLQDDNVRLKKAQEHDTYTLEHQIDLLQKENKRLTDLVTETVDTLEHERELHKHEMSNKTITDRNIYNEKNRINDLINIIKTLEGKVIQCEKEYKDFVIASKKRERSKPDSDSVKKSRELQKYKEQVEAMNMEITKQREQYEGQIHDFKNRIYELEVANAEETELKEAAKAKLDNTQHRLQNLEKQYESLSELVEANEAKQKSNDQDSNQAYFKLKEQVEKLMEEVSDKDKQIVSLNTKLREVDRETKEDGSMYSKSLMAKIKELEDTVSLLKTQLENAEHTLKDTLKEKEQTETELMTKKLELEQRDVILKEKMKIAELREELVTTLKSKEHRQEVCVQKLKAAIMVKESENEILAFDSTLNTNKQTSTSFMDVATSSSGLVTEMTISSKRAAELYTNLEQKQMELLQLQRRVKELEDRNENSEKLRIRHEARINHLEQALGEKCLTQPGYHRQSEEYYNYGIDQYLGCKKNVRKHLQKYCETIKIFVAPDLGGCKDNFNIEKESCQWEPNKLIEVMKTAKSLLGKVACKDNEIAYLSAQLKAKKYEVKAFPTTQESPLVWRMKILAKTVAELHYKLGSLETELQYTITEKERMEVDLMKKTIELEQRDNIAFEETKLCVIREKLVDILQNGELDTTKDFVDNLLSTMAAVKEYNIELFVGGGTCRRKYPSVLEFLNSVSGRHECDTIENKVNKHSKHSEHSRETVDLVEGGNAVPTKENKEAPYYVCRKQKHSANTASTKASGTGEDKQRLRGNAYCTRGTY